MKTLHFETFINAPREKVWHSMLDDAGYREWTANFGPGGSSYKGDWSVGSKMLFLGGEGNEAGGMASKIVENRKYEYVNMEHVGIVDKGTEKRLNEADHGEWMGAHENYAFADKDGGTLLTVNADFADEYAEAMKGEWEKALVKLKEICER